VKQFPSVELAFGRALGFHESSLQWYSIYLFDVLFLCCMAILFVFCSWRQGVLFQGGRLSIVMS
jgi:hypothetical protein